MTKTKITFPDKNFRKAVREYIKKPRGSIFAEDVADIISLNLSEKGISDLTGIEHFTALRRLDCTHNQLTQLDLSKNTSLIWLDCSHNKLTGRMDLTNSPYIVIDDVHVYGNKIKKIVLSGRGCMECPHSRKPDIDEDEICRRCRGVMTDDERKREYQMAEMILGSAVGTVLINEKGIKWHVVASQDDTVTILSEKNEHGDAFMKIFYGHNAVVTHMISDEPFNFDFWN